MAWDGIDYVCLCVLRARLADRSYLRGQPQAPSYIGSTPNSKVRYGWQASGRHTFPLKGSE